MDPASPIKSPDLPYFPYASAALVVLLTLFGSHLATPLYALWQAKFGFSTTALTIIFACYPCAVTAGLLFGGRIGDRVGRRPMILAGILLTAASSAVYLMASSGLHLAIARIVNGVAIGLMSGPALATIVELHPSGNRLDGSRMGASVTLASPAIGLLASVLAVHCAASADEALRIPFILQMMGLVIALPLAFAFPETIAVERLTKGTARRPFPKLFIKLPPENAAVLRFCSMAGAYAWSITGLWLALGPSLVLMVLGPGRILEGGLMVIAFLSMAGLIQFFTRGMLSRTAISYGLVLVPISLCGICVAMAANSALLLLAGALVAGAGQGLAWMGCAALVNEKTESPIRASVLSLLYVAGYFGAAIPIVITGILTDHYGLFASIIALTCAGCAAAVYLYFSNRAAATTRF